MCEIHLSGLWEKCKHTPPPPIPLLTKFVMNQFLTDIFTDEFKDQISTLMKENTIDGHIDGRRESVFNIPATKKFESLNSLVYATMALYANGVIANRFPGTDCTVGFRRVNKTSYQLRPIRFEPTKGEYGCCEAGKHLFKDAGGNAIKIDCTEVYLAWSTFHITIFDARTWQWKETYRNYFTSVWKKELSQLPPVHEVQQLEHPNIPHTTTHEEKAKKKKSIEERGRKRTQPVEPPTSTSSNKKKEKKKKKERDRRKPTHIPAIQQPHPVSPVSKPSPQRPWGFHQSPPRSPTDFFASLQYESGDTKMQTPLQRHPVPYHSPLSPLFPLSPGVPLSHGVPLSLLDTPSPSSQPGSPTQRPSVEDFIAALQ